MESVPSWNELSLPYFSVKSVHSTAVFGLLDVFSTTLTSSVICAKPPDIFINLLAKCSE